MMRCLINMPVLLAVFAGLQFTAFPISAWAYEPSLEEIIARSAKDRSSFGRAIIETQSAVFDPIGAGADTGDNVRTPGVGPNEDIPEPQEAKSFRQTIYWVRNKILAVETFSSEGELLHFYLAEVLEPISVNLTNDRLFSDIDVLNPYLPFIEDNRESWKEGLDRWGLLPSAVSLVRASKGRVFYRLAESPGKSLWLERKRYLPVRINTLVEGGIRPLAITIEFSDFILIEGVGEQLFVFPRTVNHLLDGVLFKQTTVTGILVNPSWRAFPLTRLRKKAGELAKKTEDTTASRGIR